VSDGDSADRSIRTDDGSVHATVEADQADLEPPEADTLGRFTDSRRPWLRARTKRDRSRRLAALYWSGLYVLLMAGITSMVSFLVVRGYLLVAPGPTNTGASVSRRVVPWVVTVVYLVFAFYVTRSLRRLLVLAVLFLAPTAAFLMLDQATSFAQWIVSWVPGTTNVYGLTAFGPVLALVLLGVDFVRWQLWVEFPQDSCWTCGARIRDERWIACPYCDADLDAQRYAAEESGQDGGAEDEAAASP